MFIHEENSWSNRRTMSMWIGVVTLVVLSYYSSTVRCQFYECHDDSSITPPEGTLGERQFTWLAVLQYIHIKRGTPHYFRLPRVVLISRQFVLSTAVDASQVPTDYALGNVAFGNYERDEDECRLSMQDLEEGVQCDSAVMLMPIADVLVHPEYKHFGVRDSLAILKLVTMVKSAYMLPVCLPFKNFLIDKNGIQTRERIMHVDYTADVPRDFADEEKVLTRISLLPKELCHVYEPPFRRNTTVSNRLICSTGCGFHSGAPTIVHEHTGHWSIVAFSTGGPACPDPLRSHRPSAAARHVAIHPYVPWITAAITGKAIGAFAKDDPFGYMMPRSSAYDSLLHQWLGHWWMGGLRCFDRGDAAEDMYKFYHEVFSLHPTTKTFVNYYLEISSPLAVKTICVKVGLPFRYGQPRVWDLDTPVTKISIPVIQFSYQYSFQIEAWGYNVTATSESSADTYFGDYRSMKVRDYIAGPREQKETREEYLEMDETTAPGPPEPGITEPGSVKPWKSAKHG